MAAANISSIELDPRPLPSGWTQGYDEEEQKWCYFHYDTSSPTISYIHPLDINTGTESLPGLATETRRLPRPLPKPPATMPPQLQQPVNGPMVLSSSPEQLLLPPTYPPPLPSPGAPPTAQNPTPMKLSPAQQLYASSFANREVSVPSVPTPSLRPEPPDGNQHSLYKASVAAYVSTASPSDLRAKSPASTASPPQSSTLSPSRSSIQSLPHTPRSAQSFEPQSPPYSDFSLPDDDAFTSSSNTCTGEAMTSTSYSRGFPESDSRYRARVIAGTASRAHRNDTSSKSLFPLKYVDMGGAKRPEVRTVSTTVKPPAVNTLGAAHITPAFQVPISPTEALPPYSAPLTQTPLSPSSVPVVLGASVHPQSTRPSTANASTTPAQIGHQVRPPSLPQPPLPISAPPPPPLSPPHVQKPYQGPGLGAPAGANTPIRPQTLPQPNLPQTQQLQHPHATSNNARPQRLTKPNKRPPNLMGNFGSAFANALGRTAVELGTSALLSSLGVEQEEAEGGEGGGIADTLISGLANLTVGGGESAAETPLTSTEYAPPAEAAAYSDPGYYTQEQGPSPGIAASALAAPPSNVSPPQPVSATGLISNDYQSGLLNGLQYTSFNFEPPTLELHSNHGGGNNHGGGQTNNWNPTQMGSGGGSSYQPQVINLPAGAQQPHGPQQALHRGYQNQPHSQGWNPYQFR